MCILRPSTFSQLSMGPSFNWTAFSLRDSLQNKQHEIKENHIFLIAQGSCIWKVSVDMWQMQSGKSEIIGAKWRRGRGGSGSNVLQNCRKWEITVAGGGGTGIRRRMVTRVDRDYNALQRIAQKQTESESFQKKILWEGGWLLLLNIQCGKF